MNQVNIIGRLTKETTLAYTPSGNALFKNGVAVRRDKERTDFINIVAFNKTAELIANHFKKGDQIGINGSIVTGSYEKDGKKVYTQDVMVNSITFIDGNKKEDKPEQLVRRKAPVNDDPFANGGQTLEIDPDELPF